MQCNCIHETTQKMTEHMKEKLGDTAKAECNNIVLLFSGETRFSIPFQITADKPGYRKGKVMNMVANYCPICGKPAVATPEG